MRFRSVLFTPGTRPDRIEKAIREAAADIVVADLEDAVAPKDKIEARIAVRNALLATQGVEGAVRAVRINAWPSRLAEEDLEVVLTGAPDLLVVPKAESAQSLAALAQRLDGVPILAIIETAAGVLAAQDIAAADGVVAVAVGAEDLAADAGMRRTPGNEEVRIPRALVALAAAAAGIAGVDMITADFEDLARCRQEADEARAMGFAGKMCIHPAQVAVVHEAMAPTKDEQAWAKKVIEAAEAGGASQGGVVVVDGKMVDVPLVKQARRFLEG